MKIFLPSLPKQTLLIHHSQTPINTEYCMVLQNNTMKICWSQQYLRRRQVTNIYLNTLRQELSRLPMMGHSALRRIQCEELVLD